MNKTDQAFQTIQRIDFVPKYQRNLVNIDAPLYIGFSQTISQPTTVRLMLSWLDAQPDDKILDIGSGSGWTTALLSEIVGSKGKVFAVERIPELVKFGRDNCENIGITNANFFQAGKEFGLPEHSPYDRILVSASAAHFPKELLSQLEVGGKLVIPVQNDILEITKTDDSFDTIVHPGFVFVPLIK